MQSIPCPVCKTPIPFEIEKLLNGMKFICPNCHAAIGLGDNRLIYSVFKRKTIIK